MDATGLVLVGVAILVGLLGVLLPLVPGLLLCWGAVLVWALVERTAAAWTVLVASSLLVVVSQVVKYLVPGRRLRSAGVPWGSLAAGGLVAVVGFFVVPVVGAVVGFIGGVYGAERLRLKTHAAAWPSTVRALEAVGLSVLIELVAGLLIGTAWLAAVLLA
ncbi:MAG TPA: DUF456 domain-containing protein [Actinomycetota bacterium]|nr:DUF456 domain-containing protein [Actinomycetota bacterium]